MESRKSWVDENNDKKNPIINLEKTNKPKTIKSSLTLDFSMPLNPNFYFTC